MKERRVGEMEGESFKTIAAWLCNCKYAHPKDKE